MKKLLPILIVGGLALGVVAVFETNKPWWLHAVTGDSMPTWVRDLLGLKVAPRIPDYPRLPTGPRPIRPPQPKPCPGPDCPQPRRPHNWGARSEVPIGATYTVAGKITAAKFTIGGPELDGVAVACDLPAERHLKNVGGSDGAGLCVFTSGDMSADWCNEPAIRGFRDWMKSRPGGGTPNKVKQMITEISRERGVPEPPYIQVTNGDESILEEAHATRRILNVTYGGSDGIYYRGYVPHMVCLVCYDKKADRAAILDNNYPGQLLWMSCADFVQRWKAGGGGWAWCLLQPGPPPVPTNTPAHQESIMQCANGQCANVPAIVQPASSYVRPVAASTAGYAWSPSPDGNLWFLFRDGKQVGSYRRSDDTYSTIDILGQWHTDVMPPIPVPEAAWPAQRQPHVGQLFGVDVNGLKGAPAYEINGKPVAREQLIGALKGGLLPDTKSRLWLSLAGGTDAQRKKVADQIATHPAFDRIRDKVIVKSYEAGAWPLAVGLVADGSPTIQLLGPEDANGRAQDLGHFDSDPGPEQLAAFIEGALRQRDPNYEPERRRPDNPLAAIPTEALWIGGALLAAMFLLPRRRR